MKAVRIDASGEGFGLVEVSQQYSINVSQLKPAFSVQAVPLLFNDYRFSLIITISRQPASKEGNINCVTYSNMAVMEISLPSGFIFDQKSLEQLQSPITKHIDIKNGDSLAIVHFEHVMNYPVRFVVDGIRLFDVDKLKPAGVKVYDYFDKCK